MKTRVAVSVFVALGLLTGAGAVPRSVRAKFPLNSSTVLEKPDRMTLYSLAPEETGRTGPRFHGWPVVKQKEITDPKSRSSSPTPSCRR